MQKRQFQPTATAHVKGSDKAPHLSGEVRFYQQRNGVFVIADISGLPESDTGFFAFHIHEGSRCSGKDFADTLGHYNPKSMPHPKHAGDLVPLLSCNGKAYVAVLTNRFEISKIIGKTVVIHSDPDDFHTQPAGNAGTKIACGVIERTNNIHV